MSAFYNEIEPFAVEWLRNLITAGHIDGGVVDERSIKEIDPSVLDGYQQAHFFAGIGVWSYALRVAGWPSAWSVHTGSCPCQPWSQAGRGGGFDDERHLWSDWIRLIRSNTPAVVLGEQVASRDGLAWFDVVRADLEASGYTVGGVDSPAAGYGAPHIRQRLYFAAVRSNWLADSTSERRDGIDALLRQDEARRQQRISQATGGSEGCGVAFTESSGWQQVGTHSGGCGERSGAPWLDQRPFDSSTIDASGLGHSDCYGGRWNAGSGAGTGTGSRSQCDHGAVTPSAARGYWSNAVWIPCADGKHRPIEPGIEPLADGAPGRVGKLRAYGNGLNAIHAIHFVRTVIDFIAGIPA